MWCKKTRKIFAGGPLRTTLTGFSKPITSMVRSEDKVTFAAGSKDGLIIVWQVGEDEVLYSVKAHEESVTCLAISGKISFCRSGKIC